MSERIYPIDGIEFVKRTDFTLDESEEIGNLLSVTMSGNNLLGNFNGNFKKFLSMVLVRKDGKPVEDISIFGKMLERTAMEIFKDFFFGKLKSANDMASSLSS